MSRVRDDKMVQDIIECGFRLTLRFRPYVSDARTKARAQKALSDAVTWLAAKNGGKSK